MAAPYRAVRDWLPAALLLAGLVLRLGRLAIAQPAWVAGLTRGEAHNVAVSIARTGRIADAFVVGSGPTAHVMPLPMIVAGAVYRVLGIDTPLANAVLTTGSLAIVFASFWLLWRAFGLLGAPFWGRVAALAWLCLVPLSFTLETIYFRFWEGGLAAAGGAGFLLLVLRLDRRPALGWREVAGAGLAAAALLFVSPPVGLAAYLCGALLVVRRVPTLRRQLLSVALVAAITAVVLTPWTIRNLVVMGSPIPLRDNFGLEFAIANYPGAVSAPDPQVEFTRRITAVHPFRNGYPALVAAGGEVAYAQALGRQAWRWVAAHPADFARLTLRHYRQYLFPPAWFYQIGGGSGNENTVAPSLPKIVAMWLVAGLGLAGLALGLATAPGYRFAAIMTLVPVLPYGMVQPTLRYRYIIAGLLAFLACDLIARLVARALARRRPAPLTAAAS